MSRATASGCVGFCFAITLCGCCGCCGGCRYARQRCRRNGDGRDAKNTETAPKTGSFWWGELRGGAQRLVFVVVALALLAANVANLTWAATEFLARRTQTVIKLEELREFKDSSLVMCLGSKHDRNAIGRPVFASFSKSSPTCTGSNGSAAFPAMQPVPAVCYNVSIPPAETVVVSGDDSTLGPTLIQCCQCNMSGFTQANHDAALRGKESFASLTMVSRTAADNMVSGGEWYLAAERFDGPLSPPSFGKARSNSSTVPLSRNDTAQILLKTLKFATPSYICDGTEQQREMRSIVVPLVVGGLHAARSDFAGLHDGFDWLLGPPDPKNKSTSIVYSLERGAADDSEINITLPSRTPIFGDFPEEKTIARCLYKGEVHRGNVAVAAYVDNSQTDFTVVVTARRLQYTLFDLTTSRPFLLSPPRYVTVETMVGVYGCVGVCYADD